MDLPNFAFTLNQLSMLWRAWLPDWALCFASSNQQPVLSLWCATCHLRKQLKDTGKPPRQSSNQLPKNQNQKGRSQNQKARKRSLQCFRILAFQTIKCMCCLTMWRRSESLELQMAMAPKMRVLFSKLKSKLKLIDYFIHRVSWNIATVNSFTPRSTRESLHQGSHKKYTMNAFSSSKPKTMAWWSHAHLRRNRKLSLTSHFQFLSHNLNPSLMPIQTSTIKCQMKHATLMILQGCQESTMVILHWKYMPSHF